MTSTEQTKIVHMWSGPRSLSTAMMYSFAQRDDTKVLDEPLYAAWLHSNPHIFRPYREELCSKHEIDGNKVLQDLLSFQEKPVVFCKHVGKMLRGLDKASLYDPRCIHVFLVRNPLEMMAGWERKTAVHKEDASLEALSLALMCELYSDLRQHTGKEPIVVDADILQQNPKSTLSLLCAALGVAFDERMLSWPAGPKPDIDGLWAPYWYDSLHKSTGFHEGAASYATYSTQQVTLLDEALPFYQFFSRKALGCDPLSPHSSCVPTAVSSAAAVIDHGIVLQPSAGRLADPRNEHVLAWVGDRLLPRHLARVSVFDSSVQGGDAVWEGIRVYQGKVFKLDEHLQRLMDSAKAMAFRNIPSVQYIKHAVFTTLAGNGMTDGAHMRLTLTRGAKLTSSMNPAFNIFGCTLIILAEWKAVGDVTTYDNQRGIMLITAAGRRNPPQCVDSKIHHCNLINNILPKIQANVCGAADALMLDVDGFVSETNATNVFMVKHGTVLTPHGDSCLPGVTRQTVINLCRELHIPIEIRRVSLAEFYAADEVFTTGTMGELTPVREIDGRVIGEGQGAGEVMKSLQAAYRGLTERDGVLLPWCK